MKTNINNYKKFLLNKIKYLFQKTQFMFEHLPKKIAFELSWVLLLSEIKYFKPKLHGAKNQNFLFSKNMIKNSDKPNYYINNYQFDKMDSFSLNVFIWSKFFADKDLLNKKINYLEIGCFEGRSSVFVLEKLQNAQCFFVDPFQEYKEMTESTNQKNFDAIYENFLFNVSKFPNRYHIYKETSDRFFDKLDTDKKFNLIYVDGSHLNDDVYRDALHSYEHLENSGYIIFDDFFWSWFPNKKDNPFFGICRFLIEFKKNLEICYVGDQLILKKSK